MVIIRNQILLIRNKWYNITIDSEENLGETVMDKNIKLFHGSHSIVRIPDLSISRTDIDFGQGFYLSSDFAISAKWACRTANSICNEYNLLTDDLKIHKFELDKDWLDYVVRNRNEETDNPSVFDQYDVLIGAIADDKLFHTIEMYEDGLISAKNAIEIMNCMDYGLQYVLKTEKAVKNLEYEGHIKITGKDKLQYKRQYQEDRIEATRRTHKMLKELNGR